MDKMKWIIFAGIVVAIFAGVVLVNRQKQSTVEFKGDATKVITEGPIADHVYGSDAQKVILIEYGDFQCPACGSIYPTVKELKEKYKDKLTFVFRDLPLTTIHPNALAAATAAEAAGQQGKFYEMHNLLYENQKSWSEASAGDRTKLFEEYAKYVGLNIDQFNKDLSSSGVVQKIDRDRSTAKNFGGNSTPTFVLNGEKLPETTATNHDELTKTVEDALKKAGFTL